MKKIMFSDKYGLTQAVLEGRKTMTRRIAHISQHGADVLTGKFPNCPSKIVSAYMLKARYKVGESVAIAQPYRDIVNESAKLRDILLDETGKPQDEFRAGWGNKMFTRTELLIHHIRITDIKIERLQDISDEDCLKEGVITRFHSPAYRNFYYVPNVNVKSKDDVYLTSQEAFAALIDKVSGKGTFDNNPYVFAYEFKLVD